MDETLLVGKERDLVLHESGQSGQDVMMTYDWRNSAEQNKCFDQGQTQSQNRPGKSWVDDAARNGICPVKEGVHWLGETVFGSDSRQ